jgi:hypothetical protein
MKVKHLPVKQGQAVNISNYPNFSVTGSVRGMKKVYGQNALLVRCGAYIYNVPQNIYNVAH